jgi:putative protein-disulfide isomerase
VDKQKDTNETFCATQDCMNNKKAENNFKAFSIQKEPIGEILYFGDPMCSWCWGITNDLEMLKEHFKQELQFELILGGLRPGGGDKWDKKMKKMLKGHWGHVNDRTGQPFNYELFNWGNFNYDTEPPSRAVRVIRDLIPEEEFNFF